MPIAKTLQKLLRTQVMYAKETCFSCDLFGKLERVHILIEADARLVLAQCLVEEG